MNVKVHLLRTAAEPAVEPSVAGRARVKCEMNNLDIVDVRLAGAVKKLGEIDSDLAALDAADKRAIEQWAAQSGASEAPKPALVERKRLLDARRDVEAERQGFALGAAAVLQRRQELAEELRRIDAEAMAVGVASFGDDFAALADAYSRKAGDVRRLRGDLAALTQALCETGRDKFSDRGDGEKGKLFFAQAERLRAVQLAPIDPTDSEFAEAVTRWKSEISARIAI